MTKKNILYATSSVLMLISSPAMAAETMSMAEMQAQLKQLSAQVEMLSNALEKQKQVSAQSIANIAPAAGGGVVGDVKISMKPSLKIESSDGKYSFQPFGRAHTDLTMFADDKKDHASNVNFRRARLGVKGKMGDDLKYKSEIDFAEENVAIKEVSLTYTGLNGADIKIGNHKPSFGMEQNTSSNYMMFMERTAPTNSFTRSEMLGVNVYGGDDNWSFAVGAFNEDAGNADTGDDEDFSIDARATANILGFMDSATDNVLHIGAGISHRRPTGSVRFKAKPTGDGDNMIDTGSIAFVDSVNIYGVEAQAIFGSLSFQSEYFNADISRSNGNADANLDGFYAQAGWFLTGESRPYKGKAGKFGRAKPNSPFSLKDGTMGAWEVLARYESTDLNDASAGITGGKLNSTTLGVNWLLSDRVRLMANVIDVNTDNDAVVADDDPTIYNVRAMWDF